MDVGDAINKEALLVQLRPWLRELMHAVSTCELKNPARTEYGVVFTFKAVFDTIDETALVRLREAVDLTYRALALHRTLALDLGREGDCDDRDWTMYSMEGVGDASVERQLERAVPFEMALHIVLDQVTNAAELKRTVADRFVVGLSRTPSSDTAFVALRAELDRLLVAKNPQWAEALASAPIKVTCDIETPRRTEMSKPQAEVFFEQLTQFRDTVEKHTAPAFGSQAHLPVEFEVAQLKLWYVPITPAVVTSVSGMQHMELASLKTSSVTIDPRLVACSREQLGQFLRSIRATSVSLLPDWRDDEEIAPMDAEVNAAQFLRDLLTAIVDCETVETLNIGGLFNLFVTSASRIEIFQILVDTVMVRVQPLDLTFDLFIVGEHDARVFTSLTQTWKTQHPNKRLRLKRLALQFHDSTGTLTNAIIDELDEVEELSLTNHDENAPRVSTGRVTAILEKFPTLRELSLGHVDLESMVVLSEKAPPTLTALSLRGLRLHDRQSFLKCVESLGYQREPFTRQLRVLKISDITDSPHNFRLWPLEVEYLESALHANKTLEYVRVLMATKGVIQRLRQTIALTSAAGSVVPAPVQVRQSCEEKQRRVAFLSVIYAMQAGFKFSHPLELDTFLIRYIFAFSDPWVARCISTH